MSRKSVHLTDEEAATVYELVQRLDRDYPLILAKLTFATRMRVQVRLPYLSPD